MPAFLGSELIRFLSGRDRRDRRDRRDCQIPEWQAELVAQGFYADAVDADSEPWQTPPVNARVAGGGPALDAAFQNLSGRSHQMHPAAVIE